MQCTFELILSCEALLAELTEPDYRAASSRLDQPIEKSKAHGFMLTACDLKFRQALLAYKAGNLVAARVWLLRGLEESKPMQNRLSMEHLERTYPELCALVEREKQTDLLSEREIEVLRLVEACLSNSEIGQRLFISVYTVKSHVQRICGKLGVRRRAQAVVKAKSLGIM